VPVDREELRAAEAHIAHLEEELLRLKDVKRELQSLREEHQRLRRSVEGRLVQWLVAPLRVFRGDRVVREAESSEYERWFERHRVAATELARLRVQSRSFVYRPLISILMPTFNSDESFLRAAVKSVTEQCYENWQLIVADDRSDKDRVQKQLEELAQCDRRIDLIFRNEHGGISAALNSALGQAAGEWIALLDHDDLIEPDALFRAVELLQTDREADVIYSDEDKIIDGHFAAPMLKPDWSPEFFCAYDYLGHFVFIRRELAAEGFRAGFDGAQDYDLLVRVSEKTGRIRHIPRVLYHWRRTAQSTAHNIRRKPGALEAGRQALEEHLARRGEQGRVRIDWDTHAYWIRREIAAIEISIVIAGGNAADAERIRARTDLPDLEILSGDNAGIFRRISNDWVLLLDCDLEPLELNWLRLMAEQLANREVGAVGARILRLDDTIESAGYLLTGDGMARAAFAGFAREHPGVNRQLQVMRNYSAVSASCLLTRTNLFLPALSSLDIAQNDPVCVGVQYCLMLGDPGFRTVTVPYAEVRRTRSTHDFAAVACAETARRWAGIFHRDPCYNPNLAGERADFSLGT
jgi:GT2 family glycosyltransferase